jgi:hypothetical protein
MQEITIGNLDFDNNLKQPADGTTAVSQPIPLRPNMKLQCGDNGSRSNLCFILNGHIQMDGTSMRGIDEPKLDNVLIQGFTFVGALEYSLLVTKPGTITFRDCEWTVRRSKCHKLFLHACIL